MRLYPHSVATVVPALRRTTATICFNFIFFIVF
jgi:hypothetical protein